MSGTITMTGEEYDALHAEAEALRVVLHEIASVNPAERGIEWAKSYASDGLKGAGSELYARWLETFKEAEALRAALSAQQSAPERGDGWIPVNERLPSMVQEVIVNSEFDGVTAGILDSYGEWYSPNSDYKLTRVVAWQPLPAAPSLLATHRGQASGCHSEGDQNE